MGEDKGPGSGEKSLAGTSKPGMNVSGERPRKNPFAKGKVPGSQGSGSNPPPTTSLYSEWLYVSYVWIEAEIDFLVDGPAHRQPTVVNPDSASTSTPPNKDALRVFIKRRMEGQGRTNKRT